MCVCVFRRGHSIGYEISGEENYNDGGGGDPIVLLNGFGVGSFHQHRLMENFREVETAEGRSDRVVYGVDYLGQGRSWPVACEDGEAECEKGLIYSADT